MAKTIDEYTTIAYDQAESKGFHKDRPKNNDAVLALWRGNKIALMHSEVSEAWDEVINGENDLNSTYYPDSDTMKPEGVPSEIADCAIRIFDFMGAERITGVGAGMTLRDLAYEDHSQLRRESSTAAVVAGIHSKLSEVLEYLREGYEPNELKFEGGYPKGIPQSFEDILVTLYVASKNWGFDLDEAIDMKLKYNGTRPYLHGKKF